MKKITITQDRSNAWTVFSVFLAAILLVISFIGMIAAWPFEFSFVWFILPMLFIGSLFLGTNYIYWILVPKKTLFEVSQDVITIEDQPVFTWKVRRFDPAEIIQIVYNTESSSYLKTKDGKTHLISDILMMRKKDIFAAVRELHPHIETSSMN